MEDDPELAVTLALVGVVDLVDVDLSDGEPEVV